MDLVSFMSGYTHNKISEADEGLENFIRLYQSWGEEIKTPEDFSLFLNVVKHDLGIDEVAVTELVQKAVASGEVDQSLLQFLGESKNESRSDKDMLDDQVTYLIHNGMTEQEARKHVEANSEESKCKNCQNVAVLMKDTIRCPKCGSRSLAWKSDSNAGDWKVATSESKINEQPLPTRPDPEVPAGQPEPGVSSEPRPEIATPDDQGGAPEGEIPQEDQTDEQQEAEQLPEKEYLGSAEGEFFYINRKGSDTGDIEDVLICDASGKEVFSARKRGLDYGDMVGLLRVAIDELDIDEISTDILDEYDFLTPDEPEENLEEVPQGTPPAEANPGDFGGEAMGSAFESKVNEGMKDTLKKAGVDVESGHWVSTGDAVYFRGVADDIAQAIADQLVGRLDGTVILDQKKFYKVVLESKVNEVTTQEISKSLINYIKGNDLLKKNLDFTLKEIEGSKRLGSFDKEASLDKIMTLVKEGANMAYKMKDSLVGENPNIYPAEETLKQTALEILSSVKESVSESYEILASGIADEPTAQQLASAKGGYVIPDPKEQGKFLVVADKK